MRNGAFVGKIVASAASRGTAYVTFDEHRDGDFAPYIVRTTDFGKTWKPVVDGLPADDASVRSIAEFPGHANVLFAGTERALFVTLDSGAHWSRLKANLPTTRYDDIVIQPRTKDLVLGTHGRSIWILDDASPIANWTPAVAAAKAHLFAVPRATHHAVLGRRLEHEPLFLHGGESGRGRGVHVFARRARAERAAGREQHWAGREGDPRDGRPGLGRRDPPRELGPSLPAAARPGRPRWRWRRRRGRRRRAREPEGRASCSCRSPRTTSPQRGALVAPGTFKVALEVDGTVVETRTFDVRGDPASAVTLEQQKTREAFVVEVADLLSKVEKLRGRSHREEELRRPVTPLAKLQALQVRLVGAAGGGRGRGGGGGGRGGPQPVRQQLSGLFGAMTISGAQTGTLNPPTGTLRAALGAAKSELASIEKELNGVK